MILLISKSDSTGGAAVVSRRLAEALRAEGADARLLVVEKKTDLPWVIPVGMPFRTLAANAAERLEILCNDGFDRSAIFKVDTGRFGLPLWRHPAVKEADAVILNYVNQGMLSLRGVERIADMGKRVVWTMHDMWNLTGICHHAMECTRFRGDCGRCPYLGRAASDGDLSRRVWQRKNTLYNKESISFVAVSSWLSAKARESALLRDADLHVIPNPFQPYQLSEPYQPSGTPGASEAPSPARILFAAAGLDNWIKGLDTLREAMRVFAASYPDLPVEVVLMGGARDARALLEGWAVPVRWLGRVSGEEAVARVFADADVTVNCSYFENLPGTLVEAQAYGSIPVAFDRGGQRDIITHGETGFLVPWSDDLPSRAAALASALVRALTSRPSPSALAASAARFSYPSIAHSYLSLLDRS